MKSPSKIEQLKLSLCMIVKNEEKFLEGCLQSVKNVVDQMIIVDTGSTDATLDIARRFDAEIHSFEWCDDFSAARNASILYATGKWILWMDADERLIPESIPALKKLLVDEDKPVIYRIHIRNYIKQDRGVKLSSAHRLFTNFKGIMFSGKIHEQLSQSAAALNGEERESNVILEHLGYALEEYDQYQKDKRNRQLLEQFVKDEPNNAYAHYTLAQHYAMTNQEALAKKHYQFAYDLKQFDPAMTASLLNTMAENYLNLKEYEEASSKARKSVALVPEQVGGYYLLYRVCDAMGQLGQAAGWLEIIMDKNVKIQKSIKKISTDVVIDQDRILYTLGSIYFKQENYSKAIELFSQINEKSHTAQTSTFLQRMSEACLKSNNWPGSEFYLKKLVATSPDNDHLTDMLGTVLIKQEKFSEALEIYKLLYEKHPGSHQILKKLAGMHAKLGDLEEAQQLLSRLKQQ